MIPNPDYPPPGKWRRLVPVSDEGLGLLAALGSSLCMIWLVCWLAGRWL